MAEARAPTLTAPMQLTGKSGYEKKAPLKAV